MITILISIVLVAVPGGYTLSSSRKLVRRLDDPLFPDLLLAHSQRVGTVAGSCIGVGVVLAHDSIGYVIVAMLLAIMLAGFPARRTIYRETWSLGGYLAHALRFWFALFGFFIILAFAPAAMAIRSEHALAVGVTFAVAAMLWATFSSTLVPIVLRATRFDRPELERSLEDVLSKTQCARPIIYEADAPGGTFVNAFALASWGRPGVLFTKDLLESLDVEETKAIFGHEIAHLEHHDRRYVLAGLAAALVLVAIPIGLWSGPLAAWFRGWEWAWPIALLFGLLAKLRRHRAHESESDVRAVELTGNPEALVSALTKIHTLLRLSRRWSEKFEERSTHPSLARRIRAIRRAAGKDHVEPFDPVVVFSPENRSRAMILDAEKLHELTGVPDGHEGEPNVESMLAASRQRRSIAYADIRDLRIRETRAKHDLVLTTGDGGNERMRIADEDVPTISAVLDRIDALIGYAPRTPSVSKGRLATLAMAVLAVMPPYSFALFVLAVLALVLPATVTHAALASAGLATALFHFTRPDPWALGVGSLQVALLAAVSVVPAWLAIQRYRRRVDPSPRLTTATAAAALALVVLSGVGLMGALTSALPVMHAHLWAREHSGAFVASMALAAVLLSIRRRIAKAAALVTLAAAACSYALGSFTFRERLTEDVLRARGDRWRVEEVSLTPTRTFNVDGTVSEIAIFPGDTRVALLLHSDSQYVGHYLVEDGTGELVSVEASALEIVSETEIAILTRDPRSTETTSLRIGTPDTVITTEPIAIPSLVNPELDVDADSPVWRVLGEHVDGTMSVVVSDRIDVDLRHESFLRHGEETAATYAMGPRGFTLRLEYHFPEWNETWMPSSLLYALLPARNMTSDVELSLVGSGESDVVLGRTALTPNCFHTPETYETFLCETIESGTTTFWELDPRTATFEPLGAFPGFFYGNDVDGTGRVVVQQWMGATHLVDLKNRRALRPTFLTLEDESAEGGTRGERRSIVERLLYGHQLEAIEWGTLAWRDDVLARARPSYTTGGTVVTIYSIGSVSTDDER